jgi:hypothetical protein
MTYQSALQGWHDFYVITGTAAASLVGLLFVGLSLHLRIVVSRPDVQALARMTLTSFGLTLVISLFMVIPEDQPAATGWQLVGSGIAACVINASSFTAGLRSRRRTISIRRLLLRFGLSTLAYVGVIATGGLFVAGAYRSGLGWLVGVAVVLLLVSLRNTWDLLVSVGAATLKDAREDRF